MQVNIPTPNAKQLEFMRCDKKYVGYGGARGGGKSWALRQKAKLLALRYPGIKILILRRSFPELRENHIIPLISDLKDVAIYKSTEKYFLFPNGSRIIFGYCSNEIDAAQYQGNEYDVIALDEATQFTEKVFEMLKPSVRGVNGFPKRMYFTCNPGGVGHEWVKRLFIDRDFREGEKPEDFAFIKATVYDNPVLLSAQPEYLEHLNSLSDELRKAWRDGDWDVFAGQFFPEFSRDIHVCQPFPIPQHWLRFRAIDYGLDRLAVLYVAVSPAGECYVYKEIGESNLIVSDAAKKILSMSADDETEKSFYRTLMPPDLFARNSESGKSTVDLFRENGICGITKAPNDRIDGWLCVKEYIKPTEAEDGESITSKLKIFSNCGELIKNLPKIQYDDRNACDCAKNPHDITHNLDALRYFCASHKVIPKEPEKEKTPEQKYFESVLRQNRRKQKRF